MPPVTEIMLSVDPEIAKAFITSAPGVRLSIEETVRHMLLLSPSVELHENKVLYERDFFTWTQTTAALLRAQKSYAVDLETLAEEIESLGKRDRRELGSQLQRLTMHLLKWRCQPEYREEGHSWQDTIVNAREEIQDVLEDSPSLKNDCEILLEKHYPRARRKASVETKLPLVTFPQKCPWELAQILDSDYWPEPPIS